MRHIFKIRFLSLFLFILIFFSGSFDKAFADGLSATNLSAPEIYTLNTPLNLTDIVVSDGDSPDVTVNLHLPDGFLEYGSFSDSTTIGSASSQTYPGEGRWSATGDIADVNSLLAALTWTPPDGFTDTFTVDTDVSDGVDSTVTGTKTFSMLDTTPPDTFLLSWSADSISSPTATFMFDANEEPTTFECKVDAGLFTSCSSPFTTPDLASGSHTFSVRAIDAALNIDPSPDGITWTIYDPIHITSTSPQNGKTNVPINTKVVFNFSTAAPDELQNHIIPESSPCGGDGCPDLVGKWSNGGKTLTYTNPNNYDKNTEYTVIPSVNNALADMGSLSFTTGTQIMSSIVSGGKPPTNNIAISLPQILPTPVAVKFIFNQNLSLGMTNADVKELQKFLNTNGFLVATTGAGSLGNETTKFGPLTKKALAKFQASKNISPAVGFFGPITRGIVNNLKN